MRFWIRKEKAQVCEHGEKCSALKEKLFSALAENGYQKCDMEEGLVGCGIPSEMKRSDIYLATEPHGGGLDICIRTPYDARPDGYFRRVYINGFLGPSVLQNRRRISVTEENFEERLAEILETTGRGEVIAYFNSGKRILAGNR